MTDSKFFFDDHPAYCAGCKSSRIPDDLERIVKGIDTLVDSHAKLTDAVNKSSMQSGENAVKIDSLKEAESQHRADDDRRLGRLRADLDKIERKLERMEGGGGG